MTEAASKSVLRIAFIELGLGQKLPFELRADVYVDKIGADEPNSQYMGT
jgi:hypothetical protein